MSKNTLKTGKSRFGHVQKGVKNGQKAFRSCLKKALNGQKPFRSFSIKTIMLTCEGRKAVFFSYKTAVFKSIFAKNYFKVSKNRQHFNKFC
jgi:hypothetical protein